MTIYKYPVSSDLDLPFGAKVIDFSFQEGLPYLWAIVDSATDQIQTRRFQVIGTGHEIPSGMTYIGTTHVDAPFVWHLFEVTLPRS